MKTIEDYLKHWESIEGTKPVNDDTFIELFIEFMRSKDKDHYEFTGENHYCGNTAIIHDVEPQYCLGKTNIGFEFAYSKDFVKVFTSEHQGFWSPEYISLEGFEAKQILHILEMKFLEWGGFK